MSKKLNIQKFYDDIENRTNLKYINNPIGAETVISSPKLNIPGLELTGYWENFSVDNIQVISEKELKYLFSISSMALQSVFERMFSFHIPCIVFIEVNEIPPIIVEIANKYKVPIMKTQMKIMRFMKLVGSYLYKELAPRTIFHGGLIDVYGAGILLTGKSGIGKSEIALDLVERGHRLVADDIVNIEKTDDRIIMGYGEELLQNTLEVRGLGIVNVRKAFGIRAVRARKRIEQHVELHRWNVNKEYERFGLQDEYSKILGIDIPFIKLPIYPGKNITVIIETIALRYLQKLYGEDPSKELQEKLINKMKAKKNVSTMNDERFKGDFE
ncbi:MAG: HPr(Ser) kinase/phosphatase [Candidatus Marinimicrobia bacterium]|nr:HPr(Ser) kinase/phosphatase [Candidatus Neomarinimicrobiota bacterium]